MISFISHRTSQASFIKILVYIFSSAFITFSTYSQNEKCFIAKQNGLSPQFTIVTPIDSSKYLFEKYGLFKGYYPIFKDTLQKQISGELIGDSVSIRSKENEYYYEPKIRNEKTKPIELKIVEKCNSTINLVKNSYLLSVVQRRADNSAYLLIGHSNKEYTAIRKEYPAEELEKICYYNFVNMAKEIESKLLSEIHRIYKEKEDRFKWFSGNDNKTTLKDINDFIHSYDYCETDKRTLYLIMINSADSFLKAINEMNDDDFFLFNLQIDNFPKDIDLKIAITKLENSNFKSKRKNKIIRKLKKNVS
jgi:hypothetical protein